METYNLGVVLKDEKGVRADVTEGWVKPLRKQEKKGPREVAKGLTSGPGHVLYCKRKEAREYRTVRWPVGTTPSSLTRSVYPVQTSTQFSSNTTFQFSSFLSLTVNKREKTKQNVSARRCMWNESHSVMSYLENPMDGGAWWAAVHEVAKSWTHWVTSLSLFTFMHWRRKWQPTPVFLPGESWGPGSLVGGGLWGRTESDMTEAT